MIKYILYTQYTIWSEVIFYILFYRYSTVYLDPKTGSFVYSNRIVELFPEREGSPDHWFFNDQGEETMGTNTVPRSASVPPVKQLQPFVSFVNRFNMNNLN